MNQPIDQSQLVTLIVTLATLATTALTVYARARWGASAMPPGAAVAIDQAASCAPTVAAAAVGSESVRTPAA